MKEKKPFYKKKWFIALAIFCACGTAANLVNPSEEKTAKVDEPPIAEKAETGTSQANTSVSTQPDKPAEAVDNYGYTEADHETFKRITKEISMKHLPAFEDYPESWVYVKWDDEAIATTAKYDAQEVVHTNVPQEIMCVFSYNPTDGSYIPHFFGMGGTIYETDGYADEGIAALIQLGEMINQ